MSRWRDENSNHIISKLLKEKGFTSFDYGGSQIKNQHSGWWVESEIHPELHNIFLGCTLKDAVYTLKETNFIVKK